MDLTHLHVLFLFFKWINPYINNLPWFHALLINLLRLSFPFIYSAISVLFSFIKFFILVQTKWKSYFWCFSNNWMSLSFIASSWSWHVCLMLYELIASHSCLFSVCASVKFWSIVLTCAFIFSIFVSNSLILFFSFSLCSLKFVISTFRESAGSWFDCVCVPSSTKKWSLFWTALWKQACLCKLEMS